VASGTRELLGATETSNEFIAQQAGNPAADPVIPMTLEEDQKTAENMLGSSAFLKTKGVRFLIYCSVVFFDLSSYLKY